MQTQDHETGAASVRSAALALAVALTLGAPLAAQAADALRVVRDPVTGELRGPTAAEVTAFERAEAQLRLATTGSSKTKTKTKQPVEIRYADGTVETKLDEDSMMYSVVRANEDGSLAMNCLPAKEAREFVKGSKQQSAKAKAKALTQAQAKGAHNHD